MTLFEFVNASSPRSEPAISQGNTSDESQGIIFAKYQATKKVDKL